jgi:hypothetical protein
VDRASALLAEAETGLTIVEISARVIDRDMTPICALPESRDDAAVTSRGIIAGGRGRQSFPDAKDIQDEFFLLGALKIQGLCGLLSKPLPGCDKFVAHG